MFGYILDGICALNAFLGKSWNWVPKEPLVHIYYKILGECSHKGVIGKLVDYFFIVLYRLIFEEEPPYMSQEVMNSISEVVDWLASPNGTYL